ncbi:MAG: hypothetical protein ACJ74F_20470 [Mycobacterium sp.]|jgi:hypothetical protein|uniref:hypothetical protein n=1 Tax=Mycobacterium sp. TaxID=1785 RepID=UPI00389B0521
MTTPRQLDKCSHCDRYGWHTTERCPMTHTTPAALAHIAAPADADHVEDWIDWNDTGEFERYMRGTRRHIAGVDLLVTGWQDATGAVARDVHVWAADVHLDAAALRKLAALALDTADELDLLEGNAR